MEIMTFNIDEDRRNLVDDKQNFSIDFHDSKYNWLQARQYEESMRQVEVHVVHGNGSPVDLTGMNPVFEGWLPEGLYRIIDANHSVMIDAQNGIFRFDFPAPAFQIAGSYKQAFFRLMKDGMSVTTLEFSLDVMADKVISGLVPSDYMTPFEDLYSKLKDYITKSNGDFDTAMTQWKKDVADLITELNADVSGINLTITEIKTQLSALEDKIKADNLLTQADLDVFFANFKAEIQSGLEQITEFNEGVKNMNITDVDGGIPEYMLNVLNTANSGIDKTKFNLVFATDYHYNMASDYDTFGATSLPKLTPLWDSGLRKVLNATAIKNADAVVFNGDNVDEPITPNSYDAVLNDPAVERKMNVKELKDFFTTASSSATIPAFILKGNHDQNYHASKGYKDPSLIISDAEWASMYKNAVRDYGEIRNGNSNYFYKDFSDKKVRLIGLDSYDLPEVVADGANKFYRFDTSGFQQDQLDWLANTALKVPDGTTVVITSHHPIDGTLDTVTGVINHDVLLQILSDFVAGKSGSVSGTNSDVPVSVSYSFNGAGLIAGVLSGHRHLDSNVTKNGINFIETRCSSSALDSMIKKDRWDDAGTPLEDAFDIVSIDTTAKTIDLKRIGAGSEDDRFATRHFNY